MRARAGGWALADALAAIAIVTLVVFPLGAELTRLIERRRVARDRASIHAQAQALLDRLSISSREGEWRAVLPTGESLRRGESTVWAPSTTLPGTDPWRLRWRTGGPKELETLELDTPRGPTLRRPLVLP